MTFASGLALLEKLLLWSLAPSRLGTLGVASLIANRLVSPAADDPTVRLVQYSNEWEYDDNSFSQIVQEPSGSSVLMATPEGVLLKIDYERKKVTRPFKGELYNRGNSVVASPGGERFYILTSDDNRIVPGAFVILSPNRMKFEKNSLAGSTASNGALLTATSTPGLVLVSPYVYGDEPRERELRFVQIPSSPSIITEFEALVASIKIFMAEGGYPFVVADPTEPLVYVIEGTNPSVVARKIPN